MWIPRIELRLSCLMLGILPLASSLALLDLITVDAKKKGNDFSYKMPVLGFLFCLLIT